MKLINKLIIVIRLISDNSILYNIHLEIIISYILYIMIKKGSGLTEFFNETLLNKYDYNKFI